MRPTTYGQSTTSETCGCESSAPRKSFAGSDVRIEPDVAVVFPSAEAANEALRFLIRVTQDKKPKRRVPRGDL